MTTARSRAFWSGLSALGFTTAAVGAVLAFNHPLSSTTSQASAPPTRTHAVTPAKHQRHSVAPTAGRVAVVYVPVAEQSTSPRPTPRHSQPPASPKPRPTPTTVPTPTPTPLCVLVVCLSQGGLIP